MLTIGQIYNQLDEHFIVYEPVNNADVKKIVDLFTSGTMIQNPDACIANLMGAYYNIIKEDIVNATKYYNMAIGKGDLYVHVNLGLLLQNNGDQDSAIVEYTKAGKAGEPAGWIYLGLLYESKELLDSAIVCYQKAAAIDNVEALHNMGLVYTKKNDFARATLCYQQAINKGFVYSIPNLGELYSKQGNMQKAFEYYEMGAKKNNPASMYNLANFYEKAGNIQQAMFWFEKCMPVNPPAIKRFANLCLRDDMFDIANRTEERYLALLPKDKTAFLFLQELYIVKILTRKETPSANFNTFLECVDRYRDCTCQEFVNTYDTFAAAKKRAVSTF